MYLQVLGYEKNQKLMQYSWNYMNDSLRTDVFVRYQPETVACACIYLTARKLQLPLPKNPSWYQIFGATETEVRDIAIRILKLYNRPKPNIELLEKKVEELCKQYHDARVKARGGSGNNTPNNDSSSPNAQKTAGAHNAWGGFISRSGSHIAPPVSEKRSRSRSASHSPVSKHNHKRSKKHRSRSRSASRNHKKNHKRRSYSRSRSNSPHKTSRKGREKRRSTSPTNDRETKNDRYVDRYDKYEKNERYEKERYSGKEERDRERYAEKERYEEKKDRHEKSDKKYDRDEKYKEKEDKYSSREERDKYKKSKHEKDTRERSKDRRR